MLNLQPEKFTSRFITARISFITARIGYYALHCQIGIIPDLKSPLYKSQR